MYTWISNPVCLTGESNMYQHQWLIMLCVRNWGWFNSQKKVLMSRRNKVTSKKRSSHVDGTKSPFVFTEQLRGGGGGEGVWKSSHTPSVWKGVFKYPKDLLMGVRVNRTIIKSVNRTVMILAHASLYMGRLLICNLPYTSHLSWLTNGIH